LKERFEEQEKSLEYKVRMFMAQNGYPGLASSFMIDRAGLVIVVAECRGVDAFCGINGCVGRDRWLLHQATVSSEEPAQSLERTQ
jgi:hypothetical protein